MGAITANADGENTLGWRIIAVTFGVVTIAWAQSAHADEQCLSQSELRDVARMGTVMGLGGALRRCGTCLDDRYQTAVDKYEASGMLVEFRRAEAAIQTSRPKYEYADGLVRVAARKYAGHLSADCNACTQAAAAVGRLSSAAARAQLYEAEAERIKKLPGFKGCP